MHKFSNEMKQSKSNSPELVDAVLEKPYGFSIGGIRYHLYPATLGKTLLVSPHIEELGIDTESMAKNPYLEALRLAKESKKEVLSIISIHTTRHKHQLFDADYIANKEAQLEKYATDEDLATLLVICLTKDNNVPKFFKEYGIDADNKRKEKVIKAKSSNNNFVFGGNTIYGNLIDAACQRYGWTYEYVVWGISYTNLRMLLSDQITSVYVSDDEAKKARLSVDNIVISGDSKENEEMIMRLFDE